MSDLEKLEKLSLVSKICTELENHLGLNDKDLAEYIIHLAETNDSFDKFKEALVKAGGAESFPDSFVANLLRIIQRMNPSMRAKQETSSSSTNNVIYGLDGPMSGNEKKVDIGMRKAICPALAMPNQKIDIDSDDDQETNTKPEVNKEPVEAAETKTKRREKSRSRSRNRNRSRDRSRHRDRSRGRSSSEERHKDKKKKRKHSRSRSR